MKIQAINSVQAGSACQPIKQVEFARKQVPDLEIKDPLGDEDSFTPADPYTTEQKFNLACRLAAYYKTQYENLLKCGCCEA